MNEFQPGFASVGPTPKLGCDDCKKLREEKVELQDLLILMIEEYWIQHDDGCPEDDTCSCEIVKRINKALEDRV